MTVGSPSPPSQTLFLSLLSTRCCSKLRAIVCLGRLLQGGAPPLVFVQPVRELLWPSDLSLALSLEILSPFTWAITFMDVVHMVWNIIEKGCRSIFVEVTLICGGHNRISERSFNVVCVTWLYSTGFIWNLIDGIHFPFIIYYFYYKYIISSAGLTTATFSAALLFQISHRGGSR